MMKVIMDAKDIADALTLWGLKYHPEWYGKGCDWWVRISGDEITIELEISEEAA